MNLSNFEKLLTKVSFDLLLLRGKVNVQSGKWRRQSTLMKMVPGIRQPNKFKMYIETRKFFKKNTTEARKEQNRHHPQELEPVPKLILQNIYMDKREKSRARLSG